MAFLTKFEKSFQGMNRSDKSMSGNQISVEYMMSEIKKFDPNDNIMLTGHAGAVWVVVSTSDNSHIFSGGEDKNIIVWDGITNSEINKLTGHTGTINVLEITPDDKTLISGCWSGLLMVWDWKSGVKLGDLVGHTSGIYTSRLLKDGKTLFTGAGDYTAKMWDIYDRTLIRSFNCEGNSVFALTLIKSETVLICGGWGGVLRIWENISSDVKTKDVNPNSGVVQSLIASPDSKYVVCGTRNNVIIVYNYPDFSERKKHTVHNNWVRNLAATNDSKYFFSCSADKSVRFFNLENSLECFAFDRDDGYVFGLHLSKDNTLLYTGASDKMLRKRKVGIKNNIIKLEGHSKTIMCLSISSSSQYVATSSEDKTIIIWDLTRMSSYLTLTGHSETIWGVEITPDDKHVISASGDKQLKVWLLSDGSLVKSFLNHLQPIFAVSSSSDSKYVASGAQDKYVNLYNLEELDYVHTFDGHTDTIFSVKFSPDNSLLISGSADYTVRIWSVTRMIQQEKIDIKGGMIESIAISKDMKYLVLGDRSNNLLLWDFLERKQIKKFSIHSKWVKCVDVSSDNNLIASCGNDAMIYTVNILEKKVENKYAGNLLSIRSVKFTKDGKYLISGGEDKHLCVFDLKDNTILKLNQYGSQFDTFLFLSAIYNQQKPTLSFCEQSIGPLKLTLCHIYCYEGSHELLKAALEEGAVLRRDSLGNSPLHYALERNSQNCVDAILIYLLDISSGQFDEFLENCWSLRGEFEKLLKNRSIHLPDFLEDIFYISQQSGLAKFGIPKDNVPLLQYKNDLMINVNDFLRSGDIDKDTEMLVEFRIIPFPIAANAGSSSSLQMLKNISECPNKLICRTNIISIVIRERWKKFLKFIIFLTLLYWGNLAVMMVLLIEGTQTIPLIIYIAINLVLLLYEVLQLIAVGLREYLNFWNVVDLARVITCFTWIIITAYIKQNDIFWVGYIMVIFNFLRGLSGFRAFDSTRFYVRLIIRAFIDTIPFLVIFFYTTLFFGMLNWTSGTQYQTDAFISIWKTPFESNMGNFTNSNNPDLNFLYFMLTSVVNVIIILNLLISILGDSYDRFQAEAVELGNLEMVDVITEIETLMFWKRSRNEKMFPQVCDRVRFEGITDEWEGKLKAISDMIKKNSKSTKLYFDDIRKKLDVIEKKIK